MLAVVLVLSLVGLAVGPLLVAWGRGREHPSAAIDGFTLGVVPTLLALHLVPHVTAEVGPLAFALIALGYGILWFIDRRTRHTGDELGAALLLPALAVHALGDGAGLAIATSGLGGGTHVGASLGVALVLHRMPEGLALATVLVPALGWKRTIPRFAIIGGATVLGALLSRALLAHIPDAVFDGVAAFGVGAMLRMALHRHHGITAPRPSTRALSALTFLFGVSAALLLPDPDSVLRHARPNELSFIESLGPLFIETAPSMLLGLLAAGAVQTFVKRPDATSLNTKGALLQTFRGLRFSLSLAAPTDAVLPLVRRLLAASVPLAAVTAIAVGAPLLDVGGVVLSFRLFGWPMGFLRLASGLALTVAAALVVSASARGASMKVALRPAPRRGLIRPSAPWSGTAREPESASRGSSRIADLVAQCVGPTLESVAAWYVVGLCLAAGFEAAVDPSLVARIGAPLDVVVAALVAVPVSMCAQGATPFAAVVFHKGASAGAALAFALVAPGTNLPVFSAVRRALGDRAALALAVSSVAGAIALGLVGNAFVPRGSVPEMHHLVAHNHHPWEFLCAGALGLALLRSLVRMGPRAWFAAMGAPNDSV